MDGIYEVGVRASRDIDLLVTERDLEETYKILKNLGFKYLNNKTQDTEILSYRSSLPEMINGNNTKLELHWRVTPTDAFKTCPLAEPILSSRRVSNTNPNIFCPKIEFMIAHLLYHGLEQHRMNLGPIFLFDLASIYKFYNKNWLVDTKLLETLGVDYRFNSCKKLIELAENELDFSESLDNLSIVFSGLLLASPL